MIEISALVVNSNGSTFFKEVGERINEMQTKGFVVEIQYQATKKDFSALIIGRSKR